MTTLFISHAEEDGKLAFALRDALAGFGYDCWCYEDNALPGASYLLTTQRAIDECRAFLLLVSVDSMSSHETDVEVQRAHQKAKPIIPILIGVPDREYKIRKPLWAQIIGTNMSIGVTMQTVAKVAQRVAAGLRELGVVVASSGKVTNAADAANAPALPAELRALLEKLGSSTTAEKVAAAVDLVRQDVKAMVPTLVAALRDNDAKVRRGAAYALRCVKDASVVAPLLAALADASNKGTEGRLTMIGTLACHADRRAVAPLAELLLDDDARVRAKAASHIGSFGDASVVGALLACTKDSDASVRLAAVRSLAQLGDKRALPALKELLDDPDHDVRSEVRKMLQSMVAARLKSESLLSLLEKARRAIEEDRIGDALPLLNQAAEAAPGIDVIYFLRAQVFMALGKIAEAEKDAKTFSSLAETEEDRRYSRRLNEIVVHAQTVSSVVDLLKQAKADMKAGEFGKAEERTNEAIAAAPNESAGYLLRARTRMGANNMAGARDDIEKAEELARSDDEKNAARRLKVLWASAAP